MMASRLFCFCFLAVLGLAAGQPACPVAYSWVPFGTKCLRFVSYPLMDFFDANTMCQDDGATLVSVTDLKEDRFLTNWFMTRDARKASWWTSGMTMDNRIKWRGDGLLGSYAGAWQIPYESRAENGQHVVYKFNGTTYGWNVANPSTMLSFVCEISNKETYRIHQEYRGFDYGLNIDNPSAAPRGPTFLTEPTSTIVMGSPKSVYFDCVAIGNPEPDYEWWKQVDNKMVKLQLGERFTTTSGRLTILSPTLNDENMYQCSASNTYGSILSSPATLSFGTIGQFPTVRSSDVAAKEYMGTQLVCPHINAKPGLSYQWFKNSALNFIRPQYQKHTFISSTGKLLFSELTESDEGTYYCVASLSTFGVLGNYVGSTQTLSRTSLGFKLKVQKVGGNEFNPEIQGDFIFIYPPAPVRGGIIRLECFAYGTGPLEYTWVKDGKSVSDNRISYASENRIMIIRNAELSDQGRYTCSVFSSKTKQKDTKYIDLQIRAKPFFTYPLEHQHVDLGSQLTWHCEADARPLAVYSWYKDGELLKPGIPGITFNSNTMIIDSVDPKRDAGMYQCAAKNSLATTFSSAQLRVLKFAPSFEKDPMPKVIPSSANGNVTIRCNPIGAPRPKFTWLKDLSPLNLEAGVFQPEDHYQMQLNGDLLIFNVQIGDGGVYTCQVENSLGKAEDMSRLIVMPSAQFTQKPNNDKVEVNLTVTLLCQASHPQNVDMVYQWQFNNHIIDFERDPEYSLGPSGNSAHQGYLYITGVQFRNQGRYTCNIISSMEKMSASCYLTVIGPPGLVGGLTVNDRPLSDVNIDDLVGRDTTRWLSWIDGETNGSPITRYFVQYRTRFDENWTLHRDGNNIPVSATLNEQYKDLHTVELRDLKAGTGVEFRVLAANVFGIGGPSEPTSIIQIKAAPPSVIVQNIRGGGGSEGELTVDWDPLAQEDHNGPNLRYRVMWREYKEGSLDDGTKWREATISNEKACLFELSYREGRIYLCRLSALVGVDKFFIVYEARVQVINDAGDGPMSPIAYVRSAEKLPFAAPEDIYANVYNATALLVNWKPVPNNRRTVGGKLKGYKINYWRLHNETENQAMTNIIELKPGQDNIREGLIIGLQPITWYQFNVQAYNSAGNGPFSSKYEQQTLNNVPKLYPTEVHAFSIEGIGVRVSFRGVSTQAKEEPLQGYKVQVWKANENILNAVDYDFGNMNTGVITNLSTSELYELRVFAYSRAGQGARSSPSVHFTIGDGELVINQETMGIRSGAAMLSPSVFLYCMAAMSVLFQLLRRQ